MYELCMMGCATGLLRLTNILHLTFIIRTNSQCKTTTPTSRLLSPSVWTHTELGELAGAPHGECQARDGLRQRQGEGVRPVGRRRGPTPLLATGSRSSWFTADGLSTRIPRKTHAIPFGSPGPILKGVACPPSFHSIVIRCHKQSQTETNIHVESASSGVD